MGICRILSKSNDVEIFWSNWIIFEISKDTVKMKGKEIIWSLYRSKKFSILVRYMLGIWHLLVGFTRNLVTWKEINLGFLHFTAFHGKRSNEIKNIIIDNNVACIVTLISI